MADRSKIEWTDSTWNPIRARNRETGKVGHFCEHASDGCRNCYAERLQPRFGNPIRYAHQDRAKVEIYLDEEALLQPLRWKKPRMIFPCSMTDLFGEWVPDEWLDKIFAITALCPQHIFQVLTKRSARMRAYMTGERDRRIARSCVDLLIERKVAPDNKWPVESIGDVDLPDDIKIRTWPLPNVWLGISAEDQKTADLRVPDMLATPAAIRWVSAEPLLSGVDFEPWLPWPETDIHHDHPEVNGRFWGCQECDAEGPRCDCPKGKAFYQCDEGPRDAHGCPEWVGAKRITIDWIVAGGESGRKTRPMHPDWARSIRDQCAAAGVPFLFKQWGEWIDADAWLAQLLGEVLVDGRKAGAPLNFSDAAGVAGIGAHRYEHHSDGTTSIRVGKRAAGRLLDGGLHDAYPQARS
jgi:protein gp37